jgi:antirestriction protein
MEKITQQAEKMSEEGIYDPEVYQAYINIVGEDYATQEGAEEDYAGDHASDEEFAQNLADELGEINENANWPHSCIDWEHAARELMYDYSEDNGHYFRNS